MIDTYKNPYDKKLYNEKLLEEVSDEEIARDLKIKDLSSALGGAKLDAEKRQVHYQNHCNQNGEAYPAERKMDFFVHQTQKGEIIVTLHTAIANDTFPARLKRHILGSDDYWQQNEHTFKIKGTPEDIAQKMGVFFKKGFQHRHGSSETFCKGFSSFGQAQVEKKIEKAVRLLQIYL